MRIHVQGRQPLRGTYPVSGNSNAAVGLLAASMLTDAAVTLTNIPDTISVRVMLEVGESLGLKVETPVVPEQTPRQITVRTVENVGRALERDHTDALGGTLLYLAPILARRRHVRMTIDYAISRLHPHLTALRDLGVQITIDGSLITLDAHPWDHAEVVLTQTSVTATSLVCMLAATLGKETIIANAASEPHIRDLLYLLMAMGVKVEGIGSNLLTIHGRESLKGAGARISPDHIEAASIAAIGALSGGRLDIQGVNPRDLRLVGKVYERLGITMHLDENTITVPAHDRFIISNREEDVDVSIESSPWPGFPSDLIAMATVVATQARGTVLIHEKLFNNRLLFIDRIQAMGAQIIFCDPHRAIVVGPTPLTGEYLHNPDVRTGLAMLGAALCASGETVIDTAEAFDRNFDHVIDKLIGLGATIWRGTEKG